jgi:hypothetical protein
VSEPTPVRSGAEVIGVMPPLPWSVSPASTSGMEVARNVRRECADELRTLITPKTRRQAFLRHLARNYSVPMEVLYRLADRWSGDEEEQR